ncbi:Periostin [Myotis davidii]|uniref:Periostin n=1 Tax=Myotis davidii TaxID=225400 RepID=L5M2W3_MYODS|nr:Periostin [Myotis davidii]
MIPFLSIFSPLLLVVVNPANANGHYDKILAHSRIRGRDQGPNVCALQQILGTKKKYFSTCRNWYQGAICGKKTWQPAATELEQAGGLVASMMEEAKLPACRGLALSSTQSNKVSIIEVLPIDNVYGTLGIVGATTTQHYSDVSKLREEIEGKGSFTYFAPSNEAWNNLDSVVTVNCARIIHGNQIATNGVVHVIDRVLTQIGTSIQDFIEAEDDLSSFRAAAITSDILEALGRDGHFTLFAPTNEAFEKLPRGVLERIMGDKVASEALMKYHILNTLQCSEAITGGAVFETLEGNTIEIGCDGDSITVNGIKMVNKKDIVTNNGVIHLIDQVLIPDSAKQVIELAGNQQTTFADLIAQLGLASALRPDGEYTLLAPVNNAFSDDTLSMDQRLLKLILQNHILKVKVGLNELYNGQKLETIGGKQLRVFVYRTAVCIENSCMVRGSKQGRNGAIHIFREIIKPAEKSLHEKLKQDKRFSIFLSFLEAADLKELLTQPGDWTLFVPTNDAFKGMTNEEKEILIRNKNALQNIILYHLTPGVFIGKGFEPGVTNILKTIQGSKIYLKGVNDTLLVNELKSKESDIMTTNGVIHVVDKLLYPAATKIITKVVEPKIKVIEGSLQPIIKTEGPTITKMKIEGEPKFRLINEGETVTEIIHGEPIIKKYTKIIDGAPVEITEKETREERIITGPEIKYTRITTGGRETEETLKKLLQEEVTKVTKLIEDGDDHLLEDEEIKRLLQGGRTAFTKSTKVIKEEYQTMEKGTKKVMEGFDKSDYITCKDLWPF